MAGFSFDNIGDFFGGVAESAGLGGIADKSAADIGGDIGGGLVDLFKYGISNELDKYYGAPTGDPQQVVTKRNARSPAVVAGQEAPVVTSNVNGSSSVGITGVSNPMLIMGIGIALLLFVAVKR